MLSHRLLTLGFVITTHLLWRGNSKGLTGCLTVGCCVCVGLLQRAGPGTRPCYTGAAGRPGCSPSCTAPEEAHDRVRQLWPGIEHVMERYVLNYDQETLLLPFHIL